MTTLAQLEQRVQALEDVQAIISLKHLYFRLLDQQEWDALRECFTADVETHYESGHYHFVGIEAVMGFLSESLAGLRRGQRWGIHLGHHPEIELLGPDEARGLWTLHAASLDRGAGRAGRQESFYEDEYRRVEGVWRIRRTGYTTFTQGSWQAPDLEMQVGDEADSRGVNAAAREG